jgi:DNA gyrase subunit A
VRLYEGSRVIAFCAVDPNSAAAVTVAGSSNALPGTDAGTVKLTPLSQFPAKGRATTGVRAHKFRSSEDCLLVAWAGAMPALACSASGGPIDLPDLDIRRDATGIALSVPIAGLGGGL